MKTETHDMSITQEGGNIVFIYYSNPSIREPDIRINFEWDGRDTTSEMLSDMEEWAETYDALNESEKQRDIEYENIPKVPIHHMELYFWICPECGNVNRTYKSKTGLAECNHCGGYSEVKC